MSLTDDFTTKHRHRDERFSKQRKLLSNAMVMDISDASEFNYSEGAALKSLPERFLTSQHNYQNQKVQKFTKIHTAASPINYQKHRPMVCDSRFRRVHTKPKSTRSETLFENQQKFEKLPTNTCNSVSKCNSIAISTTTLNPEQPVIDMCDRIETILSSTLCQTDSSVFNIAHGACQTELNSDSKPIKISNSKTALESKPDATSNPWIFTQSKDCLFKIPVKSKKSLIKTNDQKKNLNNFKFDGMSLKPSVKSTFPVALDTSESLTHTFLRMQERSISGILMNWLLTILDIFLKPTVCRKRKSEMTLRNRNSEMNTLSQVTNVFIFVAALLVSVSIFGGFCTILLPIDFSTVFSIAKPEPKQTIEIDSVATGVRKFVIFLANMLRTVYGRERDCSIHFFSQRDKCT